MKVYLVWEKEDYSNYWVVQVFQNKLMADAYVEMMNNKSENDFWVEEKEML